MKRAKPTVDLLREFKIITEFLKDMPVDGFSEEQLNQCWASIRHNARFYTYVYLDTRKPGLYEYVIKDKIYKFDYEPFYVGKGYGNRDHRHLNPAVLEKDKNGFKTRIIKKIKEETGEYPIIIRVVERVLDLVAKQLEIDLIDCIGRRDLGLGSLANLTDGGEGTSGTKATKEAIEKRRKKMTGRHYQTPESKKIISDRQKLVTDRPSGDKWYEIHPKITEETRLKQRKSHLGQVHSQETIEKRKKSQKESREKRGGNFYSVYFYRLFRNDALIKESHSFKEIVKIFSEFTGKKKNCVYRMAIQNIEINGFRVERIKLQNG